MQYWEPFRNDLYKRTFQGSFCVCASNQWEMALPFNAIPHWLAAYTEWSLMFSNGSNAIIGSISFLLMPWQCPLPGHQQAWYWPKLEMPHFKSWYSVFPHYKCCVKSNQTSADQFNRPDIELWVLNTTLGTRPLMNVSRNYQSKPTLNSSKSLFRFYLI